MGENGSLDIHIVNPDGVRFYINPQLELIQSPSKPAESARAQPHLSINPQIRISPRPIETFSGMEKLRFRR